MAQFLPYFELIAFLALAGFIYFYLTRKVTPEEAKKRADKLLGKSMLSDEYCSKYSISHEKLLSLIGSGELSAYEGASLLFVEDVPPAEG